MFFNYRFISLSLAFMYCSITHSMHIDHLPQHYQEFLQAINNKNNVHAERMLRENPLININLTNIDGIPYSIIACLDLDNDHMLKILIDKGLDTSSSGHIIYREIVERKYLSPKIFKILAEHGALKQLTLEQQCEIFNALLRLPTAQKQAAITSVLTNGLNKTIIKRHLIDLFKLIADKNKQWELDAYTTYATHCSNIYRAYSIPKKLTTKDYLNNKRRETLANYTEIFDILKKNGLDLTLKTPDYKELLDFLANNGSTDLAAYLIAHNGLLSASDLETVITNARVHSEKQEHDPAALKFIDELKEKYLILIQDDANSITNQQKAAMHDILDYLKQQWVTHKNKSVVKLLRQFAITQRYLTPLTTPEIAHKIAQYAIADFQDQKLYYLPSYEKTQELTEQKMLEHASLNQA